MEFLGVLQFTPITGDLAIIFLLIIASSLGAALTGAAFFKNPYLIIVPLIVLIVALFAMYQIALS